jgi:hypothetical protein
MKKNYQKHQQNTVKTQERPLKPRIKEGLRLKKSPLKLTRIYKKSQKKRDPYFKLASKTFFSFNFFSNLSALRQAVITAQRTFKRFIPFPIRKYNLIDALSSKNYGKFFARHHRGKYQYLRQNNFIKKWA